MTCHCLIACQIQPSNFTVCLIRFRNPIAFFKPCCFSAGEALNTRSWLSRHYIGPKMTKCHFSNFCRKKFPAWQRNAWKVRKKNRQSLTTHHTHNLKSQVLLKILHSCWISFMNQLLSNFSKNYVHLFYKSHQSTWVPICTINIWISGRASNRLNF